MKLKEALKHAIEDHVNNTGCKEPNVCDEIRALKRLLELI